MTINMGLEGIENKMSPIKWVSSSGEATPDFFDVNSKFGRLKCFKKNMFVALPTPENQILASTPFVITHFLFQNVPSKFCE